MLFFFRGTLNMAVRNPWVPRNPGWETLIYTHTQYLNPKIEFDTQKNCLLDMGIIPIPKLKNQYTIFLGFIPIPNAQYIIFQGAKFK